MKRLNYWLVAAMLTSTLSAVLANPVEVYTQEPIDPRQDNWVLNGWVEELGVGFPADENIFAQEVTWDGHLPCPQDLGSPYSGTHVQIEIINLTSNEWLELYYVADEQTFLSNVDELVGDVSMPGTKDAFKIDAVGNNTPLVYESMNQDGRFEVGETWQFVIQDYLTFNPVGQLYDASNPDALTSPGVAYASGYWATGEQVSTGSIVAIPEPSVMVLLAMTGSAMVFVRRLMM